MTSKWLLRTLWIILLFFCVTLKDFPFNVSVLLHRFYVFSKVPVFQNSTNIGKYHEPIFLKQFFKNLLLEAESSSFCSFFSFKFALHFHQKNFLCYKLFEEYSGWSFCTCTFTALFFAKIKLKFHLCFSSFTLNTFLVLSYYFLQILEKKTDRNDIRG